MAGKKVDLSFLGARAPSAPGHAQQKTEPPARPMHTQAAAEPAAEPIRKESFARRYLPSGKKMKRWALIAAGAVLLSIGGYVWCGIHSSNKAKEERDARVQAIVKKLSGCSDIASMKRMCLDNGAVELKMNSAKMYEQVGEFVKAGKIYAQLGIDLQTEAMIIKCRNKGDLEGVQEIQEEMRRILEARKQAVLGLQAREEKEGNERKKRMKSQISILVSRLGKCADPSRISRMCISEEQEKTKIQSAESFIGLGEFEKAGIVYAKLGMLADATAMIGRCESAGNKKGAHMIRDQLKVSAEALNSVPDVAAKKKKSDVDRIQRLEDRIKQLEQDIKPIIEAVKASE